MAIADDKKAPLDEINFDAIFAALSTDRWRIKQFSETDRRHLQGILFAIAVSTRSLSFEKAAVVMETALQSLIDWGIPEAEIIRACDELDARIVARTLATMTGSQKNRDQ